MKQEQENIILSTMQDIETIARKQVKEAATDLLIDEALKYRTLLESKTAWDIYFATHGERFIRLLKIRRKLEYKARLLEDMAARIYEI